VQRSRQKKAGVKPKFERKQEARREPLAQEDSSGAMFFPSRAGDSGYNPCHMPRSSMDLRSLAGQLLILGFDGTEYSPELRARLRTLRPGGVILFSRNVESPRQTHALLRAAQSDSALPLFRCVDMEGGTVDRLRDVIDPAPSVQEVACAGQKGFAREHGRLIGGEVRVLGFNVDFAPVVDLRLKPSLAVLGSRTVSSDPTATAAYARGFLRGLKDAGVLGCGKHFPGLGEGQLDSHKALPVVNKPWKALWNEDLVPYRILAGQMPFVMVAHCAYPLVTGDATPASISGKWITGVLRGKIGYTGLVVSDDLEMGGGWGWWGRRPPAAASAPWWRVPHAGS
jgi:beta-N-acetylhexosaminidase